MTSRAAPRVSWALLVIVVAALAIGAAASILVSASSAPAPSSAPSSLVLLPAWMVAVVSAGVLVFVFGTLVVMRLSGSPNPTLNRMAVTALMAILLGVVFLLIAHFLGFGGVLAGNSSTNSSCTGCSCTGCSPPPGGGSNLTGPGGQIVSWPGLPLWLPFVIVAAIALLVVVVAVPELRRYLAERGGGPARPVGAATAGGVREALTQASSGLDLGEDPRAVILALYAALLARLQPMVMELDTSTPEEIRASHLERLGVRREAARTLTRLFEEARYSTHPMGPEAGRRAREAVRSALDDLDRRNFPA